MSIELAGWNCTVCRVFNGEEKERREACRACGSPKPREWPVRPDPRLVRVATPVRGFARWLVYVNDWGTLDLTALGYGILIAVGAAICCFLSFEACR